MRAWIISGLTALAVGMCLSGAGAKAAPKGCPPGLAKKAVPCVPPGQVKQSLRVGDKLPSDGILLDQPDRYGLPRVGQNESYYRIGDTVFRVDRDTREILQLLEAVGAVLN
ncbi:DUF1236 domain-containing protein [Meridianimarinicoccus aquatilis]|nr:DUF1236 domain-containing protein [Fluviibacterium aquatile]